MVEPFVDSSGTAREAMERCAAPELLEARLCRFHKGVHLGGYTQPETVPLPTLIKLP